MDLGHNKMIGMDGAIMIVEALKNNRSLTTLKLYDIPFGNEGARNIGMLLTTNFTLRELDISYCNIGDDGALYISDMLKMNKSLSQLDISTNPISNDFIANELMSMIKVNTALKGLVLAYHSDSMDNATARIILKTLKDNNDTVGIFIGFQRSVDEDLQGKISVITRENQDGIRRAPLNPASIRRIDIFNGLKSMWMPTIQENAVAKPMSNEVKMSTSNTVTSTTSNDTRMLQMELSIAQLVDDVGGNVA